MRTAGKQTFSSKHTGSWCMAAQATSSQAPSNVTSIVISSLLSYLLPIAILSAIIILLSIIIL